MPLNGWKYYQTLTDSSGTSLANWPVKTILSATGVAGTAFRFDLANRDGSDIRIYDETTASTLPYWLMDFNPTASSCQVFYLAKNTSNSHSINYGNIAASSLSNFSSVFNSGTGFDTNFGNLTVQLAGSGSSIVLAAATGFTDSRYRRVWDQLENPVVSPTQAGMPAGFGYQFINNFNILRDTNNKVVQESGLYVAHFGPRPGLGGHILRGLSSDGISWSNFDIVLNSGLNGVDTTLATSPAVIKVATGDYRMFYLGLNNGDLKIAHATSADGLIWNKQSNWFIGTDTVSGLYTVFNSFAFTKLADGTYFGIASARPTGITPAHIFGWTSINLSGWNIVNGGNPIISPSPNQWDSLSITQARVLSLASGLILIEYNAASGAVTSVNQIGFATSNSPSGPWVKDSNNPMFGYSVANGNPGVGVGSICLDVNGKDILHYHILSSGANNTNTHKVYKSFPLLNQGGFLRTTTTTDASFASLVLATGTFIAKTVINNTSDRSENGVPAVLNLSDYANIGQFTPLLAGQHLPYRRLQIAVNSFDRTNIGDLNFVYFSGLTINYWNGTSWQAVTAFNIPTEFGRPIRSTIKDDGTNFILAAHYDDDNSLISSASIAKSIVSPFASGRVLSFGDNYTDAYGATNLYRYSTVAPFSTTDPSIVLGFLQNTAPNSINVVFGGTNSTVYFGGFG